MPVPRRERGAIAVLVAVTIVVMLLAGGLVIDLGHLHVVKNELQNAADACALAGARDLNDLGVGAIDRITAAAVTTGERNTAGLKQVAVDVPAANVTFADAVDGPFERTVTNATRYIRCETASVAVATWLMHLGGTQNVTVSASAVARRIRGQTICAIPLAICKFTGEPLVQGNWYYGRLSSGHAANGEYDWIRFPGMAGANDIANALAGEGYCGALPEMVDGQGGIAGGVSEAWNTRFGLYANGYRDMRASPPDGTGYAYTPVQKDNKGVDIPGSGTWPAARNAYGDFIVRHNTAHTPYDPSSLLTSNGKPESLPSNPAPLSQALHASLGQDRRMVIVPVIDCQTWAPNKHNMPVVGWACALMLSPIGSPDEVALEYQLMADDPLNKCNSTGVPGGSGAMVAALVR